jgi:Protein of unknown function (DUF3000).
VPEKVPGRSVPAAFTAALDAVRRAETRPELVVSEIAAPKGLAPYAIALSANVTPARHDSDSALGTGRFVLLYDPAAPQAWGGPFRVVCYAQAPLETEIGLDPFLSDVAWSWLIDALDTHNAHYSAPSGTATRILSSGYGELAAEGDGSQIELRASWSPVVTDIGARGSLDAHVESWGDLLCMLAGLPPAVEGVSLISTRRVGRE